MPEHAGGRMSIVFPFIYRPRLAQGVMYYLYQFFEPLSCVPFDDAAAAEYGVLRSTLEKRGTPIGPNDMMIAAIARAHSLTLVTANEAEFQQVPDLKLENWQ